MGEVTSALGDLVRDRLSSYDVDHRMGGPAPILELARRLGATVVVDDTLRSRARVERSGTSYDIRVHCSVPREQWSLVVAHELSHVLLDMAGVSLRRQASAPECEEVCDAIAREIILPRPYLSEQAQQIERTTRRPYTTVVIEMARQTEVCPTIVFEELATHARWRAVLVQARWDRLQSRWCTMSVTGVGLDDQIEVGRDTWADFPLASVFPMPRFAWLVVQGRQISALAEFVVDDGAAWVVVDLST